eukprot:scaffold86950_cov21-Tisochrysis_lutea.AAC.2
MHTNNAHNTCNEQVSIGAWVPTAPPEATYSTCTTNANEATFHITMVPQHNTHACTKMMNAEHTTNQTTEEHGCSRRHQMIVPLLPLPNTCTWMQRNK